MDSLEKELDLVAKNKDSSNEQIQVLKEKFPRGGAMGLLEMNPHLVTILSNFLLCIRSMILITDMSGVQVIKMCPQ